jgi:site-specific DNA-methyltransferase (adenine-specific)
MAGMDANSVDAIVTDPPYGLSFMGKGWDKGVPGVEFWVEALRVAKPGAHLLAFGGTRMVHRLAVAIEDAGWEIRDRIHWVYGSGFPKSHNVSKAIDKAAGAEREVVGFQPRGRSVNTSFMSGGNNITAPATPAAQQWDGWGTALKPSVEPVILARKPFKGTVAANVLEWGTGAINVDGCRVGDETVTINTWDNGAKPFGDGAGNPYTGRQQQGRFPANLIHDGSDEATAGMGDASRYFYCAKASRKDRNEGLEGFDERMPTAPNGATNAVSENRGSRSGPRANHHPTVKPTDLMAYLCRLITPPGGTVLDPFNGSGSTGKAAVREGFNYIGCELDPEYVEIARARIEAVGVPA